MADKMSSREPGDPGCMQGQIKTPMCTENVGNKGDGGVKTYKGMPEGSTDNGLVMGPGAKGKWDTQVSIRGSNVSGRW